MRKTQENYYFLYQFLGGYFHQDWKDDYDWKGKEPLFEDVVHHYKTEDSKEGVVETINQLTEFLNSDLSDEEIHRIVEEDFSSWYTPRSRGMNKRKFLEKVLEILKEPDNAQALKRIA